MSKRRSALAVLAVAAIVAAIGAVFLFAWDPEGSRREAYIYRCNEEGAGGMFTSREYCADLYERSRRAAGAQNAN